MAGSRKGLGGKKVWLQPRDGPCTYCGEEANQTEHVIPYAWLRYGTTDKTEYLVPACGSCNAMLSQSQAFTVRSRAEQLADRMEVRYSKLLKQEEWTEAEIHESQLEGKILRHVRQQNILRAVIRKRIAVMRAVAEGIDPEV